MGCSLLGELAAFVLASASAHQPHAVAAATAGVSAPALHRMLHTHACLCTVDTIAQMLAADSQLGLGTQPGLAAALVSQICTVHERYCTGSDQQYASADECASFLSSIQVSTLESTRQNSAGMADQLFDSCSVSTACILFAAAAEDLTMSVYLPLSS